MQECRAPETFAVTWEFGEMVSWLTVTLTEADGGAVLELAHEAPVDPQMWTQFGPGAVGVGWDLGLMALGLHLESGAAVDPADRPGVPDDTRGRRVRRRRRGRLGRRRGRRRGRPGAGAGRRPGDRSVLHGDARGRVTTASDASDASDAPDALDALGDPSRRRILELLAGTERTVGELVAGLQERGPISQPAVSQHLAVLRGAGLVRVRPEGTRRFHAVDEDGVAAVRGWLDRLLDPFEQPLDALATEVARGRRARRPGVTGDQPAARRAR